MDATKLSTMEYMYVRSTNKLAAFMGATFTRISGKQLLAKVRTSCCCRWWLLETCGLLPLSCVTGYILIKTERTSRAVRNTIQVSQRRHHSDAKQVHSGCVKMCIIDMTLLLVVKYILCVIFSWFEATTKFFLTTKIS